MIPSLGRSPNTEISFFFLGGGGYICYECKRFSLHDSDQNMVHASDFVNP
jgi:hypothetical protein